MKRRKELSEAELRWAAGKHRMGYGMGGDRQSAGTEAPKPLSTGEAQRVCV